MRTALSAWLRRCLLALPLLWLALGVAAQDVLPVPPLSGRVIDQTATLSAAQTQALTEQLAAYEQAAGSQIVILMVPTTAPEDLAAYAFRVADAWKIGRREVGDGLLIVVAKDDRRVRIEVARALEGAIPDLAARQIIDRTLRPAFREGDYAGGLHDAVDAISTRLAAEGLPAPTPQRRSRRGADGIPWPLLLLAVPVVGGILTSVLGRGLGSAAGGALAAGGAWLATHSLLLAAGAGVIGLIVVASIGLGGMLSGGGLGGVGGRRLGRGSPVIWGGGGGGGWGGGGGGGWGSGGGGSFGGGGASGGW